MKGRIIRRKKIEGRNYFLPKICDQSSIMLKTWPFRFPHWWHSQSQKAQKSQHAPLSDIGILLNLCFENAGMCLLQSSKQLEVIFISEQCQAHEWALSYIWQEQITFHWVVSSDGIYKRNWEDVELCYSSEENCRDEVVELQNNSAGK